MKAVSHYLPRVALAVCAVGSVLYAAIPVMRHGAGIIAIETGSAANLPAAETHDRVDLAPLLERAPFGLSERSDDVVQRSVANTPKFVLRGVFASAEAASAALLEVDGATELYREAENVTAAFVLAHVAPDHVTLTGNGQTITLGFYDEEIEGKTLQAGISAAAPEDLIARLGRDLVVPVRAEKPKPPETTSEYIDYWRKRIQKNPKAVLDEIGLTPSDDGYVIADQHDVGVRLAGLKAGDLVRSVNGQSVGNPDDDRRFYDRIAASGQARLEVERNGRVLTFSFPLR